MIFAAKTPVNYWRDDRCAKAFWGQKDLPAYKDLLADTQAWLDPRPGERWLDLGCGSGQLTRTLWESSGGRLSEILAFDVAALNAKAYERLKAEVQPAPGDRIRFEARDFAQGLPKELEGQVDGVVSGLALQYAEAYSESERRWTTAAYDRMLAEIHRVLKPGGRFVFSVNVPEPAWSKVARQSLANFWSVPKKGWYLVKAWRMWRYGGWLTRESRAGRFHYLPIETIHQKLTSLGFRDIEHRLSYAKQAYVIRARKG